MQCTQCGQGKLFALAAVGVASVPVLADVVTRDVSQGNLAEAGAWTEARLAEMVRQQLAAGVAEIRAEGVAAEPVIRIGVP